MNHRSKPDLPDILTVEEIASYLKVTERSIYGLLSKGEIPAFKVGGSWRFKREEIEGWIKKNTIKKVAASDDDCPTR